MNLNYLSCNFKLKSFFNMATIATKLTNSKYKSNWLSRTAKPVPIYGLTRLGHHKFQVRPGPLGQNKKEERVGLTSKRIQIQIQPYNVPSKPNWTQFWVRLEHQGPSLGQVGLGLVLRINNLGQVGWGLLISFCRTIIIILIFT